MASVRSSEPLVKRAEAGDAAVDRLNRLQAITDAALSHLGLDELLDELLLRLREVLTVDTAVVLLSDDDRAELVARAAKGLEEEVEQGVRIPLKQGFAGRIAAERRPIVLSEVRMGDVVNPILVEKGLRALMGVPLVAEGRVLGVVHVGSLTPREFSRDELELLRLAADRMAAAIAHATLYEEERKARADAERAVEQLRQIQAITDVALGYFSLEEELLGGVLERVRDVLGTDTAAVLLLDHTGKELVARAAKGLEEEVEQGTRIPVGGGFAGRIAAERRPVFLPEVDHTKVLNPILLDKGIRSMLGVPLLVEGRVIGVMHVATLTPREFTADDTSLLELAADRIAIAIDRARHHGVARALQQSLLPPAIPAVPGLVVAARYLPGADDAHVGGDWYDVMRLPHGRVGVVMGDVVSRGVRAAAAMGALRTALRAFALDGSPPGRVLARLNDLIRAGDEREMATVAYAVIDPRSGEMTYALAGHPPLLVVDSEGDARFLDRGRSGPVGVVVGGRFDQATDALGHGETLLLYTDGLVERRDEPLDEGLARLHETAVRHSGWPDELCDGLLAEHSGTPDDVALLAARRSGPTSERLELRFRAVSDSLSSMRRSLAAWLDGAGADDDEAYDVLLAVGEAAANAVEHAYGPVEEEFELGAELLGGDVHVSIRDRGRWRPARGANRGRGLMLMEELMDHVDVASDDEGTVVRMRRRLTGGERR